MTATAIKMPRHAAPADYNEIGALIHLNASLQDMRQAAHVLQISTRTLTRHLMQEGEANSDGPRMCMVVALEGFRLAWQDLAETLVACEATCAPDVDDRDAWEVRVDQGELCD